MSGAVTVKAQLPGDTPKVQVKLALPDDFVSFRLNAHCLKPAPGEQPVYRMGNQRFGTATIIPPPGQSFNILKYTSREDKQLVLPFSLTFETRPRSADQLDFTSTFRINKLVEVTSDDTYFPLVEAVQVSFVFPPNVSHVQAVSHFP